MVHEFATKYFALPENHTPVIQDAVSYASEMAHAGAQYDYVVHDVFTGGAEPVDLFTLEFLQDLNAILKPGGVIAIVSSPSLQIFSPRRQNQVLTIPTELRRRSPPPSRSYNSKHHQNRLPNLPHIPRISRSIG